MTRCPHCAHCAALPAPTPVARKSGAPGSRNHERCVHHEPIAMPNLRTPVLCFDARPANREIRERIAFAAYIDKAIGKAHAAHLKRPTGDGLIAMGDGRRLTPRRFKAWQASEDGRKAARTSGTSCISVGPAPVSTGSKRIDWRIPTSKFTGTRRRRRKVKAAA